MHKNTSLKSYVALSSIVGPSRALHRGPQIGCRPFLWTISFQLRCLQPTVRSTFYNATQSERRTAKNSHKITFLEAASFGVFYSIHFLKTTGFNPQIRFHDPLIGLCLRWENTALVDKGAC